MWHRIAVHVLHCTVNEAQRRLSSAEFTDMIAYYRAEPFGNEIDDYRFGTQTAAIVNTIMATLPRKRGSKFKAVSPRDYHPQTIMNQGVQLTTEQKAHIRRKRGKRGNSNR